MRASVTFRECAFATLFPGTKKYERKKHVFLKEMNLNMFVKEDFDIYIFKKFHIIKNF